MDSLYFLLMLIGIGWLAWWAVGARSPFNWSPFDMREAKVVTASAPTDDRLPRRPAPGRVAAGRNVQVPASPADLPRAGAAPAPPLSWRLRRRSSARRP